MALKYPKGSKDYSPATPAELAMLAKANKDLMAFLAGIGVTCVLNHFSGNGYGLAIPVHFANGKEVKKKFEAMNKVIQDSLADFPQVEIDNGFASPRQPWSIPGSLNKKAGRATLRRALNYDNFTPEDLGNSRESNTMCIEAHLAEAQILVSKDLQSKRKSVFNETASGPQSEMAEFLTQWDNDHCFKVMLKDHGYELVRDFGHKAFFKRPGKEGPGHGLVVGGQKNRLWNWSSSDSTFPVGQAIKPYWAWLLLKGIASGDKIVDQSRADDFYREVAETYRARFTLKAGLKPDSIEAAGTLPARPATLKPVDPITPPAPRPSTGTLAEFPMPGIIEELAQDIGARNPKVSPSIDRAMALSLFQLMIGKSRKHESGTYCNSWIVNLAPSSAGKEAGKLYGQRFMNQVAEEFESSKAIPSLPKGCYGYKIVGVNGSNGGSPQGIEDELLMQGRVLIIGDESEKFIHPALGNDRAVGIRDLLLSASSKGIVIGRALSGGMTRPSITHAFISQVHTTQPKPYFESFLNESDYKGSIGRYLHFEANKGLPRYGIKDSEIKPDLIKEGLYWQGENLKGLNTVSIACLMGTLGKNEVPFLGRFKPDQLTMSYCKQIDSEAGRVHQYRIHCDEQAEIQRLANNGLLERFWDKAAENSIRLAMTYTLAIDRTAPAITIEAWDLATNTLENSRKVLINNRGDILKCSAQVTEEEMMKYIKAVWSDGRTITVNDLYTKFRGRFRGGDRRGHADFEQAVASFQEQGLILVVASSKNGKSYTIVQPESHQTTT